MTDKISDETTVRALLQMSGVTPSEEEIASLVVAYAHTRVMVDSFYSMPGVRYEEPAVIFDARA
jgi:hypothetical protein